MKKLIYIFLLLIIFSSCNIFKNIASKNDDKSNLPLNKLLDSISNNSIDYNTLYIKYSAKYTTEEQNLNFYGTIRIQKDSALLITFSPGFGIEIGRALVTTDSIKFYSSMQNTYFKENSSFFQEKYGLFVNFSSIQALLTNQIFTYPYTSDVNDYTFLKDSNLYLLENKIFHPRNVQLIDIEHKILINSNNFQIDSIHIMDNITFKTFDVKYVEFQTIENKSFPRNINFLLTDKQTTKLNFTFKKVLIDKKIKIKLKIPKNAKKMEIPNN